MARDRTTDAPPRLPKARSDAYVGLLALALVAQIAGAAFLYLDYAAYGTMTPAKLPAAPAASAPAVAPAGGQPQGGQPQGGQPMPMP